MNTNTSKKTFLLVEGALMIAMAFVLSYIKLYDMPMGGSITLEAGICLSFKGRILSPKSVFSTRKRRSFCRSKENCW